MGIEHWIELVGLVVALAVAWGKIQQRQAEIKESFDAFVKRHEALAREDAKGISDLRVAIATLQAMVTTLSSEREGKMAHIDSEIIRLREAVHEIRQWMQDTTGKLARL